MIKLTRFFLPICILLWSGYSQNSGHANQESLVRTLINIESSAFNSCFAGQGCQDLIPSLRPDTQTKNAVNHVADFEEKEDELFSFNKDLNFSNHFVTAFYTQTSEYFCQIQRRLFFYHHISYFPSYRYLYLTLQVFRI